VFVACIGQKKSVLPVIQSRAVHIARDIVFVACIGQKMSVLPVI
jgi:hypothetical protein